MKNNVMSEDGVTAVRSDLGSEKDFRLRIRNKLAARGVTGPDLEQQIEALMARDIGLKLDLPDGGRH